MSFNNFFIAPSIKGSYNYIFKNDPCRNRKKIIKIKTNKNYKEYEENTPVICFDSNEEIETVYYGLNNNMIEVTNLFKKYIKFNIKTPTNAYILCHNGLGDSITILSAANFYSQYYTNVYLLCLDKYQSNINSLITKNNIYTIPLDSKCEKKSAISIIKVNIQTY